MNFLFFIVHPSKFHQFRICINNLLEKGHTIEVCYSSKDVLDELIISEGWKGKNLFPKGRKIRGITPLFSSFIFFFLTIYKLLKYTKSKDYDLFITDDVLGIVGKIRGIPTIHFTDDDYSILSSSRFLFKYANHILAPDYTNLGKYEYKKILFKGFKQSAYLRPNHFTPDINIIKSFNPSNDIYFLLRVVSLKAAHDMNKKGINNNLILHLISNLEKHGKIFISSERTLPEDFEKYRLKITPKNILHAIFFAELFISDSQSMSLEAAMLGTPFIRFNSFVGKISVLDIIENKYKLGYGINSNDEEELLSVVNSLLSNKHLKEEISKNRLKMIDETIDLSAFMIWLFENYPSSIKVIKDDPNYQIAFK